MTGFCDFRFSVMAVCNCGSRCRLASSSKRKPLEKPRSGREHQGRLNAVRQQHEQTLENLRKEHAGHSDAARAEFEKVGTSDW